MVSPVIGGELAWGAFTILRGRSTKETLVHILAMYYVVHVPPSGFVVAQVVFVRYTASLPVTSDVFPGGCWCHHRDVDFPLPEPLGTLNDGIRACQRQVLMTGTAPTIGGTGKERTNLNFETLAFKDLDCKKIIRIIVKGFVPRRRTDVTCASKRNGCRESANATTNNSNS